MLIGSVLSFGFIRAGVLAAAVR
jgi:hypothetical protein